MCVCVCVCVCVGVCVGVCVEKSNHVVMSGNIIQQYLFVYDS